jgi:hypothetical protein
VVRVAQDTIFGIGQESVGGWAFGGCLEYEEMGEVCVRFWQKFKEARNRK